MNTDLPRVSEGAQVCAQMKVSGAGRTFWKVHSETQGSHSEKRHHSEEEKEMFLKDAGGTVCLTLVGPLQGAPVDMVD